MEGFAADEDMDSENDDPIRSDTDTENIMSNTEERTPAIAIMQRRDSELTEPGNVNTVETQLEMVLSNSLRRTRSNATKCI